LVKQASMAGTKQALNLLGMNVSPFAFRARVALNIKGVSYEYIEQDLFHKCELLLSSNPVHRKEPVLIHDGKPVCESLVVVQYMDEVWSSAGASILPVEPYERATSRFWAAYIDDKVLYMLLYTYRSAQAFLSPVLFN
jgi:glutathione S-transferase